VGPGAETSSTEALMRVLVLKYPHRRFVEGFAPIDLPSRHCGRVLIAKVEGADAYPAALISRERALWWVFVLKYPHQTHCVGSWSLSVCTGQNPRRHVVLKNTSQMRTICPQIGRNLSVYLSLHVSFSPGGGIFLQIRFSLN
jgi:hypothetical protein